MRSCMTRALEATPHPAPRVMPPLIRHQPASVGRMGVQRTAPPMDRLEGLGRASTDIVAWLSQFSHFSSCTPSVSLVGVVAIFPYLRVHVDQATRPTVPTFPSVTPRPGASCRRPTEFEALRHLPDPRSSYPTSPPAAFHDHWREPSSWASTSPPILGIASRQASYPIASAGWEGSRQLPWIAIAVISIGSTARAHFKAARRSS